MAGEILRSSGAKCRSGGMADALRSGRSVLTGMRVQISPSAPLIFCACSSVWIERGPAKAEVVGSNPTKRTIDTVFPAVKALTVEPDNNYTGAKT